MTAEWVYKVCTAEEWRQAAARGRYEGSADDARDGFVHLSKASQLPGVLTRFFAGKTGLVIVALPAGALADALKWEGAGDERYPHYYGALDTALAVARHDLPTDETARAAFLCSLA